MPAILSYIRSHRFDIVTFQEVTGGAFSKHGDNTLETLKKGLGMEGEIVYDLVNRATPKNYYGSAVLYSSEISLVSTKEVRTAPIADISVQEPQFWKELKRSALSLTLQKDGVTFEVVTTHGAWSNRPDDTPLKVEQAERISAHLKTLKVPFIFTGDLNVDSSTEVVRLYEETAVNLIKTHGLTNTLNPRTHYVKKLFPAGLAVDYIFASRGITVSEFGVVETPDLSDHFGLRASFKFG